MIMQIPKSSIFRPVTALFKAIYNAPSLGFYDFAVALNTNRELMKLNGSNLYYIAIVNFATSAPSESAYMASLASADVDEGAPAAEPPKFRMGLKSSKEDFYGNAYPLQKYLVNNEVGVFFSTKLRADALTGTMKGRLIQGSEMLSSPSLTAVIGLNIFEITDRAFIGNYNETRQAGIQISDVQVPPDLRKRF